MVGTVKVYTQEIKLSKTSAYRNEVKMIEKLQYGILKQNNLF